MHRPCETRYWRRASGLYVPEPRALCSLTGNAGIFAQAGAAAVSLLSQTPYGTAGSDDPQTFALNVPSNCNLIVIHAGHEGTRTIQEVRVGATGAGSSGEICTNVAAATGSQDISNTDLWYLANPTTGTRELWIDLDATTSLGGNVWYFQDANTSTPLADSDLGLGNETDTVATSELTPSGTNILVAGLTDGAGSATFTWSGSITGMTETDIGTAMTAGGYETGVSSGITPSVTRDGGGSLDMALSAALVQ